MECRKCGSNRISIMPIMKIKSKNGGCLGSIFWFLLAMFTLGAILIISPGRKYTTETHLEALCNDCGYRCDPKKLKKSKHKKINKPDDKPINKTPEITEKVEKASSKKKEILFFVISGLFLYSGIYGLFDRDIGLEVPIVIFVISGVLAFFGYRTMQKRILNFDDDFNQDEQDL